MRSASATVSAVITQATAGTLRGNLVLTDENGTWKIARLDTSLLGADPGALAAASAFCAALQSQHYTAAYALLSPNGKGGETADQFAAQIALPSPFAWGGCTLDLRTYKVTGNTWPYTTAISVRDTATGQSSGASLNVAFVSTNGLWLLDAVQEA